jgi:hypothetical protein
MLQSLHPSKHLSDSIDGEPLPLLTALNVRFHRACCPICRRVERSLRHTIEAGRALRDLPVDEEDPK